MHTTVKKRYLSLLFLFCFSSCIQINEQNQLSTKVAIPEDLYGQLFYDVQEDSSLFKDSKTFVDAIPRYEPAQIRKRYRELNDHSTSAKRNFIEDNFIIPEDSPVYVSDSVSINLHIEKLWDVLKRPADPDAPGTLIPLPNSYIVPGGRFREIYYWDSYFTMLGLQQDGEIQAIQDMVDNFSFLLDEFGFIPNGNRTYYLGRSQPPFYAAMVGLLAEIKGEQILLNYLPYLEMEYTFWMRGEFELSPDNPEINRVVLLEDGTVLNRYWDAYASPRPESYREDVATAREAISDFPGRKEEVIYRDIRAAAESGWDFSSRWLSRGEDGKFKLSSIRTTRILPVDLNSLLYNLEITLAKTYKLRGDNRKAREFENKAQMRKDAIQAYFWNLNEEFYMDYDLDLKESTPVLSLAGLYPLYFKIANEEQAKFVSQHVKKIFLKPGGVITTPNHTGEQWDAPNGWAPLQWITIQGLRNYGENSLANQIKKNWLQLNLNVYNSQFKMLEKYNVEDLTKESGGGEYPTQDGFGWTNGVFQKLSMEK